MFNTVVRVALHYRPECTERAFIVSVIMETNGADGFGGSLSARGACGSTVGALKNVS